ncbi:Uncharacterised protein r2_g1924 [Pycnogonum litorale]
MSSLYYGFLSGFMCLALISKIVTFHLTSEDIQYGISEARTSEAKWSTMDEPFNDAHLRLSRGLHLNNPKKVTEEIHRDGQFALDFMTAVCKRKGCNRTDVEEFSSIALPFSMLGPRNCQRNVPCPRITRQYRTFDGTCNNLRRTRDGSAKTAQKRFEKATFDNGFNTPRRKSVNGGSLPEPRIISDLLLLDNKRDNNKITLMLTYFGQLLDHDFTNTPSVTENGNSIQCCPGVTGSKPNHPACLAINIPTNDTFYAKFKQRCMNFVRSSASPNQECTFGVRESMDDITAFIDASFVYGSDENTAKSLRLNRDGLLKTFTGNLLPIRQRADCSATAKNCFFTAGDGRANENVALTMFHTIFMREHNRVAKEVKRLKPNWNDEKIYQESRKIVIGFVQNIAYSEYLPLVIGPAAMSKYGLNLPNRAVRGTYKIDTSPSVRTEFTTAAYRFGHTIVESNLVLDFGNGRSRSVKLEDVLLRPYDLYERLGVTALSRGMAKQVPQQFDLFVTSALSKNLFKSLDAPFGRDLASINIQRGRDHGIATYNQMRTFCGLRRLRSFNGGQKARLGRIYANIDDVDLFVGGISELPVRSGIVGKTFACVIGNQFKNFMDGDRFFFTNGSTERRRRGKRHGGRRRRLGGRQSRGFSRRRSRRRGRGGAGGGGGGGGNGDGGGGNGGGGGGGGTSELLVGHQYTDAQVREFRKANLARIFCDNTELTSIQSQIMKKARRNNRRVRCNGQTIPSPSISVLLG